MTILLPTAKPEVLVTGTLFEPAGTVIGPSGKGCQSGVPALLAVGSLMIVAFRPFPDESSAAGPEASSNLYEATLPAPARPLASALISVAVSARSLIWKSSTVPLRYGWGYCERPIQFWVVLPRLDGWSVMLVFVATKLPLR